MFRVGQGGQRAVAPAARQEVHGDATPDRAWKVGGLFYFNPHDPAIWVEKRVGLGYTLNIGNSRAWLLIRMMLAPRHCRSSVVLRKMWSNRKVAVGRRRRRPTCLAGRSVKTGTAKTRPVRVNLVSDGQQPRDANQTVGAPVSSCIVIHPRALIAGGLSDSQRE
jgi:uncharacterized protein DUF5808